MWNVHPVNFDSDNDGLTDAEERKYYTQWYPDLSPNNNDTDGDNYTDGQEIKSGTNPTYKYSHPGYVFMFYVDLDNNLNDLPLQKNIDEFQDISRIWDKAWVMALFDSYNTSAYRYYMGYGYHNESVGQNGYVHLVGYLQRQIILPCISKGINTAETYKTG